MRFGTCTYNIPIQFNQYNSMYNIICIYKYTNTLELKYSIPMTDIKKPLK